jgi:hypothetical protein
MLTSSLLLFPLFCGASFRVDRWSEADKLIGLLLRRRLASVSVWLDLRGGFGYDIAMVVASLTDLAEPLGNDLHTAFSKLQKQIKYGLSDLAAIAFLAAGFADRVVASMLSVIWPA